MTEGPVFVTGGSGVVGRAVVTALIVRGRTVVGLTRSEPSRRTLETLGARVVFGDVTDKGSLEAAMRGCSAAFHLAGVNAACLRDPSRLYAVNVGGSRNVVDAAARAGVARLVHTSSAATIGERSGEMGKEDSQHRGWFLSDYERSKFDAEQAVRVRAQATGVEVVCVNPASVQGPGRAGGTTRILIAFLEGRLRLIVPTRLSLVDIADCAEGHVLALTSGKAGERYILSGATLDLGEALTIMAGITGVARRPRAVPAGLAVAAGALVEMAGRLSGRTPILCREVVRTLRHGHAYDGSRAERELGLRYTRVEDTLRRTVEWLVEQNLVSPEAVARRLA